MSLALAVKHLLACGASHEAVVSFIEEAEASKRAKATERVRKHRNACNVTDVTTPPLSPPMINNSTPSIPTPDLPSVNPPKLAYKADESPLFIEFWDAYPRKIAKGAAAKAFRNALRRSPAEPIIAGARRYASSKPDPQFTKHASTWLNADCWLDELDKKPGMILNGPWKPIEREPERPKISEEERQRNLAKLRGALKQSIDMEKPNDS